MPNIVRGSRPVGLMQYLVGPGRGNEHTEPRLVAGDPVVSAWLGDDVLDKAAATQIGKDLDLPRKVFGTDVKAGHVWHCSLSLHEREGALEDEVWAKIATDVVEGMGFAGGEEAPCRWVAVRHGASRGGNDHIHLVVTLVREDGAQAKVWRDRPRVQQLCRDLEAKYGLERLDAREAGRGGRGVTAAEQQIAERRGAPEPDREALARRVRGCAAASEDEAEFVRRVRQEGLWIRARYAAGTADVVAGYSVAIRPATGERPVWFGGGRLARDLTLPRLREGWPSSPQSASAAVAEWHAAGRGERVVSAGREAGEVSAETWERASSDLQRVTAMLRAAGHEDRVLWAHAARDAAGVFAAWSMRLEPNEPGPLTRAAAVLARGAQIRASHSSQRDASYPSVAAAARVMRVGAAGGRGAVAEALMWRQIAAMMRAVYEAHVASGEANTAADMARMVRDELRAVDARMAAVAVPADARTAADVARQGLPSLGPAQGRAQSDQSARRKPGTNFTNDQSPER